MLDLYYYAGIVIVTYSTFYMTQPAQVLNGSVIVDKVANSSLMMAEFTNGSLVVTEFTNMTGTQNEVSTVTLDVLNQTSAQNGSCQLASDCHTDKAICIR